VHVLGHHQPRCISEAGHQIVPNRFGDQLVKFLPLRGHWLIASLGVNTQHRRQQRHRAHRIQQTGSYPGFQQSQPFGLIGAPADAAAPLQQGAHRMEACVGVKRRTQ